MEITNHGVLLDNITVYSIGSPDYDNLIKAEKRALLLPLVDVIREFYKNPENRAKFEKWKSERQENGSGGCHNLIQLGKT